MMSRHDEFEDLLLTVAFQVRIRSSWLFDNWQSWEMSFLEEWTMKVMMKARR